MEEAITFFAGLSFLIMLLWVVFGDTRSQEAKILSEMRRDYHNRH